MKDEVVDGEEDDDDRNDDCRDHGGKGNGFCGTVLSVAFRHFALTGGSLFGFLRRVLRCGGGARAIFLVPLRQIASFAHFSEAVLFRCGESPGVERCGVAVMLRAAHLGDPEIDEMSTVCSDDDVVGRKIAVDDAVFVKRRDCIADSRKEFDGAPLFDSVGGGGYFLERFAGDVVVDDHEMIRHVVGEGDVGQAWGIAVGKGCPDSAVRYGARDFLRTSGPDPERVTRSVIPHAP